MTKGEKEQTSELNENAKAEAESETRHAVALRWLANAARGLTSGFQPSD